jgi:parvulin-like peptidyl-prolyl isomerase
MRIVPVLILFSFACTTSKGEDERRVVATVNDTPIYADALDREVRRGAFDDDEGGEPTIASRQAQRKVLLTNLIDRRLLFTEAERQHVVVGIDEVEAAYKRTRAKWSSSEIDALLQRKDVTPAELKRDLRDLLTIKKYLRDHLFARIAVTDKEISDYIEAHPEVQVQPEEVHALHIVVKTEEKAKAILRDIRAGAVAFGEAAEKNSLSPEAEHGGDLGFFTRGSMPSIFDEVCFNLREGEVSEVVGSDYGYHLFKVVEKRQEALKPVAQVRDTVEQKLRQEKERQTHRDKLEELRSKATIVFHDKELANVQ